MKQVTATGQNVDEAVESALAQLKTTKDRTEIDVIDEGKKGIFGLFGTRPAVVKVTVKIDAVEEAVNYLKSVGLQMGAPIEVDVKKEGKTVLFTMSGEKIALLIGKRGQTLNSLQFLTQLVMNRYSEQYSTVLLDAETIASAGMIHSCNWPNALRKKQSEPGRPSRLNLCLRMNAK